MKTKILMVAITLIFISCSSSKEELTDPIVGVWELKSIVTIGQEFINDCKSKDQIEIRSDKTFIITIHNEDNNCVPTINNGSWSFISGEKYSLYRGADSQDCFLTSTNTLTFHYELNSNALVYTYKKN